MSAAGFIGGGVEITLPVITLTVKTGAALEAAGQTYGNYRVTVSVVLKNADTELAESRASNFVIYTNAKVLPMFVDTD